MSMSDRELLEFAAKAAGYRVKFSVTGDPYAQAGINTRAWNPLTDDGDALRLAAKLELDINVFHGYGEVWADTQDGDVRAVVDLTDDRAADYRKAIVRAAAEIGRAMP